MNSRRSLAAMILFAFCIAIGLPEGHAQSPIPSTSALNAMAWEVRMTKPVNSSLLSWEETLEQIARGYRQRWMARAAAGDWLPGDEGDEDEEDPLEHAFLGVKNGARALLVPEGMVMAHAVEGIHPLQGDTLVRIPVSLLAGGDWRDPSFERGAPRSVSVRLLTVGEHSMQSLHPTHAASVSRIVSFFPLPNVAWSEEEKRASAVWMERLRENPVDYVVVERVDRVLGVCQIVVPLRASLLSPRASPFLDRHVDAFAAMPIESSDRVICLDSAMLRTIWVPWQSRIIPRDTSPSQDTSSTSDRSMRSDAKRPVPCIFPVRGTSQGPSSGRHSRLFPSIPR
ncbi:hypothetical protein SH467x_001879 [Pirellulaceae bacterium SH467]